MQRFAIARLAFSIVFLGTFVYPISAQIYPRPVSTPDEQLMRQIDWAHVRRHMDGLDRLSENGKTPPRDASPDSSRIILDTLYRRSTATELDLMAPEAEDGAKYSQFLRQEGTGLIKLVRNFGCDEYSNVPPNQEVCKKLTMPGGGSAFSFRRADYRQWKLADLLYDGRSFIMLGQMSLGFMVDLGKLPLDKLDLDSKGLDYTMKFVPSDKIGDATKQNEAFADGVTDGGSLYKKYLPVVLGDTYVIRSVAYRGKVIKNHYEIKYNELDYDNRLDVIAAFTVIREDVNGTVTLLWKMLRSKHSPTLVQEKQ